MILSQTINTKQRTWAPKSGHVEIALATSLFVHDRNIQYFSASEIAELLVQRFAESTRITSLYQNANLMAIELVSKEG